MAKPQVLRRLGLGSKKMDKAVARILKQYGVTEEDSQEGRMHVKARTAHPIRDLE